MEPRKVFGLLVMQPSQKPLIDKHCFGDCGKISMTGAISDPLTGGLMVCCEMKCPWMRAETDEPFGTTMSFGEPHDVYLRSITDEPARIEAGASS